MASNKKLFIQVPCLNEEATIAQVIRSIPKAKLSKMGIKTYVLIVDDGSTDKTSKIAKSAGADYFIKHKKSRGLAVSFREGLDFCIKKGADIIVNTDGDNQYDQKEIVKLVRPIVNQKADMVIGDRQVESLPFMPPPKKFGNLLGSWTIRFLTGLSVVDASSGLRAYSRDLAMKFNLQSSHTYTHETIIQASNLGATILDIPITFKKRVYGKSRLISGVFDHIKKSMSTIIRTILTYNAFKFLLVLGSGVFLLGTVGIVRFLTFFFAGNGQGHIQSLVISSVVIILGFVTIVLGIIADLISINRKILEEIRTSLKSK